MKHTTEKTIARIKELMRKVEIEVDKIKYDAALFDNLVDEVKELRIECGKEDGE